MLTIEKDGASKGKTKMVFVPYTTGLAVLPSAGGVEDQPMRLFEFFKQFIAGDRVAANNKINAK